VALYEAVAQFPLVIANHYSARQVSYNPFDYALGCLPCKDRDGNGITAITATMQSDIIAK
jgi:hypothetical protein